MSVKHFILFSFLFLFLTIQSCKKEIRPIPQNLVDTWQIKEVSGGITGKGYEISFDKLNLMENNHCKWLDSLGRIIVEGTYTLTKSKGDKFIRFHPDHNQLSEFSEFKKKYTVDHDTLIMAEECCDLYSYLFIRE